MPPPVPTLMDDLVEDILLRLPPEDPRCLFRASLVCKSWRGLLTGRAFGRRYRRFHRSPPLLGFFENQFLGCWFAAPSSPVPPIHPGRRRPDVLDSRHGLVLLYVQDPQGHPLDRLAVWDPLRRRQWEFPFPELPGPLVVRDHSFGAAVLCAADGCDHLDCRAGGSPFLVACVCSDDDEGVFYASLYSSEARAWSPVTTMNLSVAISINSKLKILVGNSLYFTCHRERGATIVRYDMVRQELSPMHVPAVIPVRHHNQCTLLETDVGVLGFAYVQGSRLCLWSLEASADGRTARWVKQRVLEFAKLLPPHAFSADLFVVGFTEGVGVILQTNAGTFTIELKSGRVKNVPGRVLHAFPYSSFYTPDQAGRVMLPLQMASSSDNIEAARDPLLQQPSMKAGEGREQGDEGEWKDDDADKESGEKVEKHLERAHGLFDSWSKAIVDGDFPWATLYAACALECMFSCHGKLSPKCTYAYYLYGCTLLYKPRPNNEPSSERDSVEDMRSLPDSHDFNLAFKMLHIARTILEKCPGSNIEKVKIYSALADVKVLSTLGRGFMQREDIDYALHVCFKALGISEHLIEPDNYWIIKLNLSMCLIFKFASNIGDALPYCAKALSLCKSRISNLKNASATEAGPERSALKYEIQFLTGMSCKLEKELEHLEQAKPTPTNPSGEQNVGAAKPRAASSTPVGDLLELLSIFHPVLCKTSCVPIWSGLQNV